MHANLQHDDNILNQFYKQALIDIYLLRKHPSVKRLLESTEASTIPIDSFEEELCKATSSKCLQLGTRILSLQPNQKLKWRCQVTFDHSQGPSFKYQIRFLPPEIEDSTTIFLHSLPHNCFLFVTFVGFVLSPSVLKSRKNVSFEEENYGEFEIFEKGISFASRQFYFLGGEEGNGRSTAFGLNSENEKTLTTWFYSALHLNDHFNASIYPKNTVQLRDFLGNLSSLPFGKCNARLKLGFSNVYVLPTPLTQSARIMVVSNITNELGKDMCDGCGLISATLARHVPYSVMGGRPHSQRSSDMPLPIMIQIRCICTHGLFKGCLMVTTDTNLCPENTIIFRESMKKADASPFLDAYKRDSPFTTNKRGINDRTVIGIVKTFEHPKLFISEKAFNKMDYNVRLNQQSVLLLSYLGVPDQFFQDMMERELHSVVKCYASEEEACKLVRDVLRMIRTDQKLQRKAFYPEDGENSDSEVENWHHDEEDFDGELDRTILGDESSIYYSDPSLDNSFFQLDRKSIWENTFEQSHTNSNLLIPAEEVRDLFLSGLKLEESYVSQQYRKLLKYRLRDLQRCKVDVRGAIFLVGAPDPYSFLEPEEVYISLPNDRSKVSNVDFKDIKTVRGNTLVTRYPMNHPGDLRRFTAVDHPLLAQHTVQPSNGGAIFFSTKGNRSPGDQMSGGDYDGDLYLIFYTDEIGFIDKVKIVDPAPEEKKPSAKVESIDLRFLESEIDEVEGEFNQNNKPRRSVDPMGFKIFRGLLSLVQQQLVGKYSNAWLKYADIDPLSPEALECAQIVRIALDAAKTGEKVPENISLLHNAPMPHYLEEEFEEKYGHLSNTAQNARTNYGSNSSSDFVRQSLDRSRESSLSSPLFSRLSQSSAASSPLLSPSQSQSSTGTKGSRLSNVKLVAVSTSAVPLHYHRDSRDSRDSHSSVPRRISNSIVGKLFDMTKNALAYRKSTKPTKYSSRLSAEMLCSEFDQQVPSIYLDFDCVVVHDLDVEFKGLFSLERRHDFQMPIEVLQRYCPIVDVAPLHHAGEIANNLYSMFPTWRRYFDCYHSIITEYRRAIAEILSTDRLTLNKLDKANRIIALKRSHYEIFQQEAQKISQDASIPYHLARLRLAGIIYLATYCSAFQSSLISQSQHPVEVHYSLSYCWEMCGKELRYNKNLMHLRRNRLSRFELVSPSELCKWS